LLFKRWGLIVVTPNLLVGGAEKVAVSLANEASKNLEGEVLLLALNGGGKLKKGLIEETTFIDLKTASCFLLLVRLFVFLLFNRGPVISCQRTSNVYVGLCNIFLFRRRLIFREASTLTSLSQDSFFIRNLKIFIMWLSYKGCTHIVANSEDTKADLLKYSIAPCCKCNVIGNPVVPRNINELREKDISHIWLNGGFKVVLSVGRLESVKDFGSIIEAMTKLINIDDAYRLIIIGDGQLRCLLIDQADKLGISEFIDFICFSDNVFAYMNKVDVYVSTSLWEGFGNTIVEAMACDLPVVGFDCPGGARQLILDDSSSRLIVNRSINELVSGINDIVNINAPRGENLNALKYRVDVIFNRYYELIDQ
jgi:glycosyltransferase involved in cell wall biosynthesis